LQVFLHLHQLRLHPLKVFHIESHWWARSFLWDLLAYSHAPGIIWGTSGAIWRGVIHHHPRARTVCILSLLPEAAHAGSALV